MSATTPPSTTTRRTLISTTVTAEDRAGTLLQRLDWIQDWTNLVVAGGCVTNHLQPAPGWDGDIDVFVVAPSSLCMKEVRGIFLNIFDWLDAANIRYKYERHSSVAVTVLIYFPDGKCMRLQLIYGRVCGNVQTLLESFDIDVCKCAYVGPNIGSGTSNGTVYEHTDFIDCFNTGICTAAKHMYSRERVGKYSRRYPNLAFEELTIPKAGFCAIFGQGYHELPYVELSPQKTIVEVKDDYRYRHPKHTIGDMRDFFICGSFPESRYLAAAPTTLRQHCIKFIRQFATLVWDEGFFINMHRFLPGDTTTHLYRMCDQYSKQEHDYKYMLGPTHKDRVTLADILSADLAEETLSSIRYNAKEHFLANSGSCRDWFRDDY